MRQNQGTAPRQVRALRARFRDLEALTVLALPITREDERALA